MHICMHIAIIAIPYDLTGYRLQSIHPQYCLDVVFNIMKQLHKENISPCMKIIFHFLKTANITSVTSGRNVLFIERPINDYKKSHTSKTCLDVDD